MKETDKRWLMTIRYRTDNGIIDVQHFIEELFEAQEIVEQGPDWNTIFDVRVVLNHKTDHDLTVEKSLL